MENKELKQAIPEELKDEQLGAVAGGFSNADHTSTIETGSITLPDELPVAMPGELPGTLPLPSLDHQIDNSGVSFETIQRHPQRSREP